MRRLLGSALAVLAAAIAAAPAAASPVKCADSDSTPDGRVFPEADASTNFLRFDEFECGTALLEQTLPGPASERRVIGESKGGHPLYDVLLTDERVKRAKEKLLVVSSIHGDEVGGREGAVRVIEDMVDPRLLRAASPGSQQVLDAVRDPLPLPEPGRLGRRATSSAPTARASAATRGNDNGRDLNRQFPVKGWIDAANAHARRARGQRGRSRRCSRSDGWYLGTDNHGQGPGHLRARPACRSSGSSTTRSPRRWRASPTASPSR